MARNYWRCDYQHPLILRSVSNIITPNGFTHGCLPRPRDSPATGRRAQGAIGSAISPRVSQYPKVLRVPRSAAFCLNYSRLRCSSPV
jgi:hypothetical protein